MLKNEIFDFFFKQWKSTHVNTKSISKHYFKNVNILN